MFIVINKEKLAIPLSPLSFPSYLVVQSQYRITQLQLQMQQWLLQSLQVGARLFSFNLSSQLNFGLGWGEVGSTHNPMRPCGRQAIHICANTLSLSLSHTHTHNTHLHTLSSAYNFYYYYFTAYSDCLVKSKALFLVFSLSHSLSLSLSLSHTCVCVSQQES